MAIAEVGAGSQRAVKTVGGADSTTLAFPANVAQNSLLLVIGSCWDNAGAPASITVTDTLSTSYAPVLSFGSVAGKYRLFIAYGIASSSGACTVTVNPAGSASDMGFAIDEFSGVDTSTPLDVDGSSSHTTTTEASDGITTGVANALVVGGMSYAGASATTTAGAGYTLIGSNDSTTNAQPFGAEFKIVTTATLYTVLFDLGATNNREADTYTAAFKPSIAAISGYARTAQQAPLVSFGD